MKKIISLSVFVFLCVSFIYSQDLVVGSYNIRYNNQGDAEKGNGWERRYPVITKLISFNDFDILGTQEVLHNQLEDLQRELPQYGYVGVGRDDGKTAGEYAPIFYKKGRFELLKSGHFWMAEQTDYPNKGWDAALPRICTWAQFKDRKKKKKIWFFNLHMDHVGVEARRHSARLVLKKIEEMCGKDAVILTGDFNVDQTHESYKLLANSNILFDSYEIAGVRYALNGTFNAFKPNLMTNSRIDHIFVTGKFVDDRYGVLTDTYRVPVENSKELHIGDFPKEVFSMEAETRLPSDHYPVKVYLHYKK
ncbi:MAG: endonuclease/exonuclease/phosphatase family protein [Prevotella sp.]|jgi:endonuclease/exonuclease/phosphatase family metal-dependent hydrolase|nr:endonuclease/exonuclease/phosphatase family protein [Prevotella sp.]